MRIRKENDNLFVNIWLMRELDMTKDETKEELESYAQYSGFKSVEDWIGHIPKPSKMMYLYFARLVPNG